MRTMSARICSYKGCVASRKKCPGIRMFRFPKSIKSAVWVSHSGNPDLIGLSPTTLSKNKLICEHHFSNKDILPSGRLLQDAVPKCFCVPSDFAPLETRICSVHFKDDDFEVSLKQKLLGYIPKTGRSLKTDAVPSINLPTDASVKNICLKTYQSDSRRRKQLLDNITVANDDIVVSGLDYSQSKRSNGDEDDTVKINEPQIKRRKLQKEKVASQYDDGPEQTTSRVHTDSEADDNTLSEQGEVDQLDDEPKSDQQIFIEENQAYKTFKINQKRERENAVHDEYQRVKKSLLEASEGLEIMFQNMKKVQREEEVEEDDCAMYVRTVADRLRQLSQCARATVKSKIDNLLFEAFLQNSTDIAEDTETIEIVESNIKIECQDESYSYT